MTPPHPHQLNPFFQVWHHLKRQAREPCRYAPKHFTDINMYSCKSKASEYLMYWMALLEDMKDVTVKQASVFLFFFCCSCVCCFCAAINWPTIEELKFSTTLGGQLPHIITLISVETCSKTEPSQKPRLLPFWKRLFSSTQSGQLQRRLRSLDSSLNVAKHHSCPFTNYRGLRKTIFFWHATKQTVLIRHLTGFDFNLPLKSLMTNVWWL